MTSWVNVSSNSQRLKKRGNETAAPISLGVRYQKNILLAQLQVSGIFFSYVKKTLTLEARTSLHNAQSQQRLLCFQFLLKRILNFFLNSLCWSRSLAETLCTVIPCNTVTNKRSTNSLPDCSRTDFNSKFIQISHTVQILLSNSSLLLSSPLNESTTSDCGIGLKHAGMHPSLTRHSPQRKQKTKRTHRRQRHKAQRKTHQTKAIIAPFNHCRQPPIPPPFYPPIQLSSDSLTTHHHRILTADTSYHW